VVQRRLDYVWMNLDVAHASGNGPAKVAQLPRLHLTAETTLERVLAMGPFGETTHRPGAEQAIAFAAWERRANNPQRRRRQVNEVGLIVL